MPKLISTATLNRHVRRAEKRGVLVSHPGRQHFYQIALAMQKVGLLSAYVTGIYYKPESWWARGVGALPSRIKTRIERTLRRRFDEELDPSKVELHPCGEAISLAVDRTRMLRNLRPTANHWRNDWFDRRVAGSVSHRRPAAVICHQLHALATFRRAQTMGAYRILDQAIAGCELGAREMLEERETHPDFADSIVVPDDAWTRARFKGAVALANHVVVGSEFAKQSLVCEGVKADRISVVPYGVDVNRFREKDRASKDFRVLFVGQLSQRKGIKYLLEAIKQLGCSNLSLTMVGPIVGNGNGLKPYRDCFTYVGSVPAYEVHRHFAQADLFVFPSLYEGSALVTYEALAAGLPVVTTPNAGSVVRDGIDGFIVPIRDVEALKDRIVRLYDDRGLLREMSRSARERATQHTWSVYQDRYAKLIERIIDAEELSC